MRGIPLRGITLGLAVALALTSLTDLPATTARMPLDEVRAGMRGVGVTVFDGARRDEFTVDVLGVLTNVMGPQRNIVVARLSGGPLAETGVIQGMSGSPVYIDDRLVGAVSYSLGSFSKDAIAGITPIDEMVATDALSAAAAPTARVAEIPRHAADFDLASALRHVLGHPAPFARAATDVQAAGLRGAEAAQLGVLLRPIATPLVMAGAVPELHDVWNAALPPGGFVTALGGEMSAETQLTVAGTPLEPGDPVGASLVRGDLTMAGTGTVTLVEDGRVYAFGHPFYNLGPAQFPMTRAHVTTLLPSLAISSKIAAVGEVLGTFDQDRSTGIYGSLGPGPSMIPMRISLKDPGRQLERTFSFELVRDPLFTPILSYTSALNTFFTWTRELGPRTLLVSARIELADLPDLAIGDVYNGDIAPVAASAALAAPLSALIGNQFGRAEIEAIEVNVTAVEEPRSATLERAWIDAVEPKAGERVPLRVALRTFRGAERIETVMVDVPAHASGRLTIEVSDAATLIQQAALRGETLSSADSLPQLIDRLNGARRRNRLYVRLVRSDTGALDRGAPMPGLPGSVLAVMEGNRAAGGLARLSTTTLGEWEIVTDHAVRGARRLPLRLH